LTLYRRTGRGGGPKNCCSNLILRAHAAGVARQSSAQLFPVRRRPPLGRRGIHLLVRRAARKASIGWASPHGLHHTVATQALLVGARLFDVKAVPGDASIRSTETYMDMAAIEASVRAFGSSPADTLLGHR
jgi:site-specific recombinase XerD